MKFVPCISWIRQGVAASRPQKVKVPQEELSGLLAGGSEIQETSESEAGTSTSRTVPEATKGLRGSAPAGSSSSDSDSEDEGTKKEEKDKKNRKRKLKSSASGQQNSSSDSDAESDSLEKKYQLHKYNTSKEDVSAPSMKGLACFSSAKQDPYISKQDETSDTDDEEREDFQLRPDDNLLVVGKVNKDEYSLQVHVSVFNEQDGDFYIHHDYMLQAPPLCLAPIGYDPGAEGVPGSGRGNLCAVGGMEPVIEIWDLDLVDALEPVATLGQTTKTSKKAPKKSKKNGFCHAGAVLDLAWNRHMEHVVASGGAEESCVILWDLEKAEGATQLKEGHTEKVQTLAWHPEEDSLLLSGSSDRSVVLWDCRSCEGKKQWKELGGEVEQVLWNHFQPFCFLVGTSEGTMHYVDSRQEKVMFSEEKAHNQEISGLCLNPKVPSHVVSCGMDESLKTWMLGPEGFELKYANSGVNLGRLHCLKFCPDSSKTVAIGGEKGDYVRVWDLSNSDKTEG